MPDMNFRVLYPMLKRCLDVLIAIILLVILWPVCIAICLAIKVMSDGNILFWSERIGYQGRIFMMPKFRTMTSGSKLMSRELAGQGDISLMPLGAILRKTSLDEIPQLWSVLRGDMSLIGPRPLLKNDYGMSMRNRYPDIYSVRPGITGLAQINGRSFISVRNKSRYDIFYAKRLCLWLDAKIAVKTIAVVFNTKNVM